MLSAEHYCFISISQLTSATYQGADKYVCYSHNTQGGLLKEEKLLGLLNLYVIHINML